MEKQNTILKVTGLKKFFPIQRGVFRRTVGHVRAVDEVSFHLAKGETLGIVGESGCGKTTLGRCIPRLVEPTDGEIIFTGESVDEELRLRRADKERTADLRRKVQMIFQDPMASLDPRMTIFEIVAEPLRYNARLSQQRQRDMAAELLERTGIRAGYMDRYPHQFSGGQRQRIGIARALILDPKLLIADEPTTALDVTVEAQILALLNELEAEESMTTIIITHDMAVIAEMTDHVIVMYAGRLAEYASSPVLFGSPLHPYTQALLKSIPRIGSKEELYSIEGSVPSLLDLPKGCYFAPRCPFAMEHCHRMAPPTYEPEPGHRVRCWLYGKPGDGTDVRPAPATEDTTKE
ncbi:MAG: ABC transporter ATP-binding protein [Spirochaetota bacterium]